MVNITSDPDSGSIWSYYDGSEGVPAVYSPGDIGFILACAALVMIMSPGVGYLYSGLLRRKNALSMLFLSMVVFSVISFQWFFWGYSLAFGAGSKFIGNLNHFGLMNVLDEPSPGSSKIPSLVFCIYQCMFATITPVIAIGGAAERARLGPLLIFVFCWATIVYDPIACWTWNPNGWGYQWGVLDFAGGGPVHMTSGVCALALSIFLGKRRGYGTDKLAYRPHSVSHVVLGTVLLWFGWFGFNGGSALAANVRAAQACIVTNTAAASAAITWLLIDYIYSRKWSAVSLCTGAVAGLIGITPAAGYVGTPSSVAIGVITAIAANYATKLKYLLHYDEALDVFATHGIGGFVGALLTALFADSRVTGFDGATEINGGWINHYYRQLGLQLANACAICAYTFVVSFILLFMINYIPGCKFRASEEQEILGIDETECGEFGYDYAHLHRDVDHPNEHEEFLKAKDETGSGEAASLEKAEPHPATPEVQV